MDGVDILSTDIAMSWWQLLWLLINIKFSLYLICRFIDEYPFNQKKYIKRNIVQLVILIVWWGGFFAALKLYPIREYQVYVSNEVKMSEFLEQYEIIEQQGEKLTVRIKGE